MFRPKWPSSGVLVVVVKDSAAHCNAVFLHLLLLPLVMWVAVGRGSRAVWGMNSLRSLIGRDCSLESHLGHWCLMCVRVFVCLCCPLFRQRPCDELIASLRSPTACERSRNWVMSPVLQYGSELPSNMGCTRLLLVCSVNWLWLPWVFCCVLCENGHLGRNL
jgi:hypothetical protein